MLRTLVLLAATLVAGRASEAQCFYLSNSSGGGAFIHCFGEPNLGCATFYVMVDRLSTSAMTSVAFFAYCDAGPPKYFDPPIACAQRCIVYPEIPAVPIVLQPSPTGRSPLPRPTHGRVGTISANSSTTRRSPSSARSPSNAHDRTSVA